MKEIVLPLMLLLFLVLLHLLEYIISTTGTNNTVPFVQTLEHQKR